MFDNEHAKIIKLLISNGISEEKAPKVAQEICDILFSSKNKENSIEEWYKNWAEEMKKNPPKPYPNFFR